MTPKEKKGQSAKKKPDPDNLQEALELAGYWVTATLGGNPKYGPHSEAFLGEPAVIFYVKHAHKTYLAGTWHRKKNQKLLTLLINMIRSEMGHQYEKWVTLGCPIVLNMDSSDEQQVASMERNCLELAESLKKEQEAMDIAYTIAEENVKDDPELVKYLAAMKTGNDYRHISKKLRISKDEVLALEIRLVARMRLLRKRKDVKAKVNSVELD